MRPQFPEHLRMQSTQGAAGLHRMRGPPPAPAPASRTVSFAPQRNEDSETEGSAGDDVSNTQRSKKQHASSDASVHTLEGLYGTIVALTDRVTKLEKKLEAVQLEGDGAAADSEKLETRSEASEFKFYYMSVDDTDTEESITQSIELAYKKVPLLSLLYPQTEMRGPSLFMKTSFSEAIPEEALTWTVECDGRGIFMGGEGLPYVFHLRYYYPSLLYTQIPFFNGISDTMSTTDFDLLDTRFKSASTVMFLTQSQGMVDSGIKCITEALHMIARGYPSLYVASHGELNARLYGQNKLSNMFGLGCYKQGEAPTTRDMMGEVYAVFSVVLQLYSRWAETTHIGAPRRHYTTLVPKLTSNADEVLIKTITQNKSLFVTHQTTQNTGNIDISFVVQMCSALTALPVPETDVGYALLCMTVSELAANIPYAMWEEMMGKELALTVRQLTSMYIMIQEICKGVDADPDAKKKIHTELYVVLKFIHYIKN